MFRYILLGILGLAAISVAAGPAQTAEATMRLRGSDLTFTGTVISFDGKNYRLETKRFGKVNLDLRRFECISGACSITVTTTAATAGPDFGIYGSKSIGGNLMRQLIANYAQSLNASASLLVSPDSDGEKIKLADSQGTKLAIIDLKTHGSNTAFSALAKGLIPIGISSRPINDEEAKLLPSVSEHILARDGLLVLVSAQNAMSAISIDQLASVFAGRITNWSQLGQTPGKINVYTREKGSGTLDTFKSSVLGVPLIARNAKRFKSDAEVSDAVAGDPQGIGFTSFAYKRKAKALAISTACGITYSPTVFNIKADAYPLSRDFFLYTNLRSSSGHAKGFVNYALSSGAQNIISGAGHINRWLEYLPFKAQGDRIVRSLDVSNDNFNLKLMRKLIRDIGQLSRLSVTFRFRSGSFALDPRSRRNVQQLATVLSSNQMRGKKVLLLGFSDAVGAFDRNRELSVIRARQVKQEILRVSGGRIDKTLLTEKGYGELLPVGCNDNLLGRARNRRVEVWFEVPPAQQSNKIVATVPPASNIQTPLSIENQRTRLFQDFLNWRKTTQQKTN